MVQHSTALHCTAQNDTHLFALVSVVAWENAIRQFGWCNLTLPPPPTPSSPLPPQPSSLPSLLSIKQRKIHILHRQSLRLSVWLCFFLLFSSSQQSSFKNKHKNVIWNAFKCHHFLFESRLIVSLLSCRAVPCRAACVCVFVFVWLLLMPISNRIKLHL